MKPPAGRIKNVIGNSAVIIGLIGIPKKDPAPKNSLKIPISVIEKVNPNPIPIPSIMEGITLFKEAKLSTLAKRIQLTTINGRKRPSLSYKSGRKALTTISTIVEKVAIMRIYAGILTFLGITFLRRDTIALAQTKTNKTDNPIPIPLEAEVVIARVGQVPSTSLKVALLFIIPLVRGDVMSLNVNFSVFPLMINYL
jgi:hypothetical protein